MAGLGGGGRSQERTILRSEFPDPRGSPAKSEQKVLHRESIAFLWLALFLDTLKGENADFAQKFPDPRTANHCNHWFFSRMAIFSADPGN
jgi:hypothetical protein